MTQLRRIIYPLYPYKTPLGLVSSDQVIRQAVREMSAHILEEKRDADRMNDPAQAEEAIWRSRLLAESESIFEDSRNPNPAIFVSYTVTGKPWLDETVRIASRNKIAIITDSSIMGDASANFSERFLARERTELGRDRDNIPSKVLHRIQMCDAFLGIWTASFEARNVPAVDRSDRQVAVTPGKIPGAWLPFEYGIAAAMSKPLKLLCENGLHTGYTDRLFLAKIMEYFDSAKASTTLEKIESVLRDLRGDACDSPVHEKE